MHVPLHNAEPATPQSATTGARQRSANDPAKYDYIDALRGYAILLVIIVHVGAAFPELPWPVKRFTNLGWYGVQLFFVVSSLTLAMSWHARNESLRTAKFMIRRFFRIAPMYYAATAYYLIVRPPGDAFSPAQIIASTLFVHGWSPGVLPTTDDGWTVVPGSWSVAAEFGFYFLLPLLVTLASSLGRAAVALVASLVLAYIANQIAFDIYIDTYGFKATDQFLFFWLPNQLPVFLLGIGLYHVLRRADAAPWAVAGHAFWRLHADMILALGALAILSVPFLMIHACPRRTSRSCPSMCW